MKKTLLVTTDFFPNHGGVSAYWSRVCRSLPAKTLTVLTDVRGATTDHQDILVRPLLSSWFWPRWIKGVFVIRRAAKEQSCEQVLAAQLLPVGSMAYVLYLFTRMPYVVQVYGMDLAQAMQYTRKQWLAGKILRSARAVIANSESTAKLVRQCAGQKIPVSVVYPLPEISAAKQIEIDKLRQRHKLDGKRIILSVGRLVPRKGQDQLIDSMREITRLYPDAVCVLVGDGPDRGRLQRLAEEAGLSIVFAGAVDAAERDAWLSLCDVFVMVSRDVPGDMEGFGMVYLEAGAFAKPVVAGRSGGAIEAVDDEKTGILVDPESKEALTGAILSLLQNPSLAKQLGEEGRRRVLFKWNWESMMERFKQNFL
jgi:phosphatidylinositol alpha-1,6-mannosyltransferase